FGIRHRGSTVPERSGVALSFCRRQESTANSQLSAELPPSAKTMTQQNKGNPNAIKNDELNGPPSHI
ncbi:hypothetical protein, partial [Pseudomonas helleri]|uniref:hypothetical protein n=1 Tax=Pseudomonas helleri TaxID=1608996 RepID=UPI001E5283B6